MKEISKYERVRCPRCFKDSSLGEWNNITYRQCRTVEMKRTYTRLTLKKAFERESDTFYLCPKCRAWSRGCNLSILTDNEELKKLGGESVFIE